MRRIIARVTLSELASQVNAYAPWELPILELVHGGQIRVVGASHDDVPVPSPEAEYMRLERRFGRLKGTEQTRAAQAYGEGQLGIQRLAQAMAEDLAEQAEVDALPEHEREHRRLMLERERIDRDLVSLERRRRADGSGPEAHRMALGRERVEAIRRAEEDERRATALPPETYDPARKASLDERERDIEKREAELAARDMPKEPPSDAQPGGEPPSGKPDAEDAAQGQSSRSRRRA